MTDYYANYWMHPTTLKIAWPKGTGYWELDIVSINNSTRALYLYAKTLAKSISQGELGIARRVSRSGKSSVQVRYGVLYHSGYHYIYLFTRLARLNCRLLVDISDPELEVTMARHDDLSQVIKPDTYHRMGISHDIDNRFIPHGYSELDMTLTVQYQH
ncbi:MAG: hypothetical protein ACSLEN_03165 [Candidatus Malihini olakiniferum]